MSTLNRDDIDAIRRSLNNPRTVAYRLGLKGRVEGSGFKAMCPVHGDRTPSLSLTVGNDGTLRVRCFGCDLAGDIFSLVAGVNRLDAKHDFPAVLEAAAALAGVTLTERPGGARSPASSPVVWPPGPPPEPAGPPQLTDERFAEIVAPILAMGRLDSEEAVRERGPSMVCADVCAYLAKRGLLDLAIAAEWAALPEQPVQVAWVAMLVDLFGEEDVARTGLVPLDDGGQIVPRGFTQHGARLVIPWRREDGTITTLQRRRLDDQKPKYVSPSGRAPRLPYGIERLGAWDPDVPVALVEGALDTESLRAICAAAERPVVALGIQGVQGWRKEWGEFFRGRVAALAFDQDAAGAAAVDKIRVELDKWSPVKVERWRPNGETKDWADMIAPVKGTA